ncbi:SCO family protein [Aggregatimonas sangjinii]|uniref:SCO family protein n=1 Tax=Aggregatimonas sangjinii TaxID=2583587 RepID=A0A5B7SR77_9FLAO|nr:SCO family protein [Aggregatimonas sangjinii]QCW99477.1 SCO family protein [Aggregatimonas sangjinii]
MIRFLRIAIIITGIGILMMAYYVFFTEPGGKISENNNISLNRLELMENRLKSSKIPDFSFTNQYGEEVTQVDVTDKIYIADFFFTSCPSICPIMSGNKQRLQEYFRDNDNFMILSHSIDTLNDSVSVLREYSENLDAIRGKWHLVTGSYGAIDKIAKEYYVTAKKDELALNSFVHDGSFILVDRKRRIRGIYDGTNVQSTSDLIADIDILLNE